MSHDTTCNHCGKPAPTGVCRCRGACEAFLTNVYKALDEPLPCGHDLSNWCDYCETCAECRDEGKSSGGVIGKLRACISILETDRLTTATEREVIEAVLDQYDSSKDNYMTNRLTVAVAALMKERGK